MKTIRIKDLFSRDEDRFKKFSFRFNDTIIDFSKNRITEETIQLLQELASECGLKQAINAMFEGEFINETEHRSVLHVALRNGTGEAYFSTGKNIMEDVRRVQLQMKSFSEKVHSGIWKGYTGKKIKYIVNIGIGGTSKSLFTGF